MLKVNFYNCGDINDVLLKYAVIVCSYNNEWVYCKHKKRDTWEIPGGRREVGEDILKTAKRELFEETGAVEYNLEPVCIYAVETDGESFGMLYYAEIKRFEKLPESEIELINFFNDEPENLTYPAIQPKLLQKVKQIKGRKAG